MVATSALQVKQLCSFRYTGVVVGYQIIVQKKLPRMSGRDEETTRPKENNF